MIDVLIIIIFIVTFILFEFVKLHDETKIIINLVLLSSFLFYIALNIGNALASKIFLILSIVMILYVPISIVYKYIEKFRK